MQDKDYINRCIELAKLGGKAVRPNPQVGAVIVCNNRIIGEGYHHNYGGPHAEVNAINSVLEQDKKFLPSSTIYVSLEPCCHYGKTPPCTDLIMKHNIPRVCIAEVDPNEKVKNKGIQMLRNHGIEINIIPAKNNNILTVFKVNLLKKRPFVQLKFAKSKDNFIGQEDRQVWLSNCTSNIYTHKLRSCTDAILIGTNTALIDNPSLTLRNYPGTPPLRIILDREARIPSTHTLLADDLPCIIFTENKRTFQSKQKQQIEIDFSTADFIEHLLTLLYEKGIYHLMVEGGAALLQSFVTSGLWDEAVIINTQKVLTSGINAVNINGKLKSRLQLEADEILVIENESPIMVI